MKRLTLNFSALLLILITLQHSKADTDFNFRGTLVNIACKVTDKEQVDVNFGDDIVAELIDGQSYMQSVPLKISCNKNYKGDVNFAIIGTSSSFEDTALETNLTGLGIRLLDAKTNTPLEINKSYIHQTNDDVTINAVPVKDKSAVLDGGEFNATARLLVEVL